ncbi:MAG TPA: T9SS type A sorting domain-containing protein [Bacteroidia bacterium]|nr:T9SS type A sorting domain-containing protein [Bacteroidia bacterium]
MVSGTTGIIENNLVNGLTVAPNPAVDVVNANFNLLKDTEVSMNVSNISGQVVYASKSTNYSAGSHTVKLDVSHLNSGMYLLEITAGGQKSHTKILVQ